MVISASLALGACASANGPSSLTTLLESLPAPTTSTAQQTASLPSALTILASTPTVQGSVTDAYSRVANKALNCWFGGLGPLKSTHVFAADAPPPSSGAPAEIVIHEKDAGGQSPRGTRAFRVTLARESDTTTRLTLQAGKLPADLAAAMERDTVAWGHGRDSCDAQIVRPPPPPPPVAEKKRQKKRVVTATR